ncbi:MAG TPA: hypothetical protein QF901_05665 [Gammaproteobacteria bacterium]|nr:hypothetical protein [Gammaproteobacteria bacterium]
MRRAAATAFVLAIFGAAIGAYGEPDEHGHQWDGSQTTPVHRLPLVDEEEQRILPHYRYAMPFSARETCGTCHDYSTIAGGLHFNTSTEGPSAGRPGEPWVWVDPATGTQLPLSYRGWAGAWRPNELGLTDWKFTQIFGRHLPGGDVAEPEDVFSDPESRWNVSGTVEINCMGCHNAAPLQDQSEWAIQMARENFRWAATAASGLGIVGGMASRLSGAWSIHDGRNPDDNVFAVPPSVTYNKAQFDSKNRALLDVAHKPVDKRCLHCHSASPVDEAKWLTDGDVHSAAGIGCADCHRNALDHNMVRGYEGEEGVGPGASEFTCAGCHLGTPGSEGLAAMGGRLGAVRPEHKGMPVIHFEKMSCTSCHSGPWPEEDPVRIRTSRANRLGIHGRAQWFTDAPAIVEPVFMKGHDGMLAPHRMMWPAFWGRLNGGEIEPLTPDAVAAVAEGILDADFQIGRVLIALGTGLGEYAIAQNASADAADASPVAAWEPVLLTPGKLYRVNVDGGLDVTAYEGGIAVETSAWARANDDEVVPLIPDFDSSAELLDLEVEVLIEGFLKALDSDGATATPVVVQGNKAYRMDEFGYVEAFEMPGAEAGSPRLGWWDDGALSPLASDFAVRTVAETAGGEEPLTEEQVGMVLAALAGAGERDTFGYVSSGRLFRLDEPEGVVASEHASAEPYAWPLAHDVRPAAQSLGAKSCTDCHAKDAPFFFGEVRALGPLKTAAAVVTPARALQGEDAPVYIYTSKVFKWFIIVTIGLLVLHIILDLAHRVRSKRTG